MIYLMSGHISLLTMKKCISLKCINLFNFLARLLLTLEKCISLECIGSCFIFSHLLTYLGPLCQLKGVSATAEKRVLSFIRHPALGYVTTQKVCSGDFNCE